MKANLAYKKAYFLALLQRNLWDPKDNKETFKKMLKKCDFNTPRTC